MTWRYPTVAETCRQSNKYDTKTVVFWRTHSLITCLIAPQIWRSDPVCPNINTVTVLCLRLPTFVSISRCFASITLMFDILIFTNQDKKSFYTLLYCNRRMSRTSRLNTTCRIILIYCMASKWLHVSTFRAVIIRTCHLQGKYACHPTILAWGRLRF